jgi:hypothetical protein
VLKSPSAWRIQGRRLREEKIARVPPRVKRAFAIFSTTLGGARRVGRHGLWPVYRPVNLCEFPVQSPALTAEKYCWTFEKEDSAHEHGLSQSGVSPVSDRDANHASQKVPIVLCSLLT